MQERRGARHSHYYQGPRQRPPAFPGRRDQRETAPAPQESVKIEVSYDFVEAEATESVPVRADEQSSESVPPITDEQPEEQESVEIAKPAPAEIDESVLTEIDKPAPAKTKTKRSRKFLVAGSITTGVIVIAIVGGFLFLKSDSGPIPKNIRQEVNFPVYYPTALPQGYQLAKNTFSAQDNIIFYRLINGGNTIVVSEQTSPPNPLDFKNTPGFGEIPSTAGEAAAGIINGAPVAVVVTEKTMINIQGSKDVSRDVVAKLAQSMSAPQ